MGLILIGSFDAFVQYVQDDTRLDHRDQEERVNFITAAQFRSGGKHSAKSSRIEVVFGSARDLGSLSWRRKCWNIERSSGARAGYRAGYGPSDRWLSSQPSAICSQLAVQLISPGDMPTLRRNDCRYRIGVGPDLKLGIVIRMTGVLARPADDHDVK